MRWWRLPAALPTDNKKTSKTKKLDRSFRYKKKTLDRWYRYKKQKRWTASTAR